MGSWSFIDYPNAKCLNLHHKPEVIYPFNISPDIIKKESIITKILYVNYLESTQLKSKNIEKLAEHIIKVLDNRNLEVLRIGELTDEYFTIVERIAYGHGLKSKEKNSVEDNMISFATKFCGHHNQKAPFYDSYVYQALKHWGYEIRGRDYKAYVEALRKIQNHQKLENFSLRYMESFIWKSVKEAVEKLKEASKK